MNHVNVNVNGFTGNKYVPFFTVRGLLVCSFMLGDTSHRFHADLADICLRLPSKWSSQRNWDQGTIRLR